MRAWLARLVVTAMAIAIGLAGARFLVRHFAPETGGSGVQEIEGMLLGLRPCAGGASSAVKFAGGVMALGAGFALGREGPTVQMGGAAALGVAHRARCNASETNALLAAGAGAGIAAAFNAPIAGVLFVVEELRREAPYNFQGYHAVLIACVAATLVTEAVAGVGPELRLPMIDAAVGPLSVLCDARGRARGRGRRPQSRLARGAGPVRRLVTTGGLEPGAHPVGRADGAPVRGPNATGGGEQIIQPLVAGRPDLAGLLLLLVLRTAATLASYAAGAPGGVFAPILGLATVAGLAYAEAATLVPLLALEPAAFAAAGMAALFTASVRAPLVAVVLVAELTDAYPALLAITLSAAMASLTAAALGGRPLYELLLERSLRLAGSKERSP